MPNDHSRQWFEVVLETTPGEMTSAEVSAIEARLPRLELQTLLDDRRGVTAWPRGRAATGTRVRH